MRNSPAGCFLGVFALVSLGVRADVMLGPGETLTWATDAPAADETITATGGTLVFDSEVDVPNNIYLGGEVAVTVNNDALVRFTKTFFQTDSSGRLVLPRTARFGSRDSGKFAFLPENAIAFAPGASDAQLRLAGYSSLLVFPDKWSNPIPYAYGTNCLVCLYGGYMVTDAAYTVPERTTIRMTSPTNFPSTTVITVPAGSTFQDRPAKFNPATSSGDGVDSNTTTVRSNDVVLAGGTFEVATGSTHQYWGNISGTGTIYVSDTRPDKARNCYHYFYGDVSGMDAGSRLTVDQFGWDNANANNGARLNSDFPGTVRLVFSKATHDIVSFGFNNPNTSGATNENWHVGALQGGSLIGPRNGEGGPRLQYSARQHVHVGTLSGKLAIFATTVKSALNTDDLTADAVADDTILYVKNGIRLHFGTVGKGVKIRYMAEPASSNVVEVGSGTIEEITFLAEQKANPVYLHGDVGLVSGPGTVVAGASTSRIGFVADDAEVRLDSGLVTLGDETLLGARPALWFDASDLSTFAPLYKEGYQAGYHEPSYLLGADKPASVYTNDFPLVEKWYDRRPGQRLNFFWNNRWQSASTFYPQFYPFIIPDGLNGKPVLSFGINRASGLSTEWNQSGVPGGGTPSGERRRMHLMQSETEGHAVYVHSCVMVFGSERGGGRGVLGGYNGYTSNGTGVTSTNPKCSDHFLRNGNGYGVENGIFAAKVEGSSTNLYETWVNGTPVVCTNTPMSGSWDVLSFHTDRAGGDGRAFRNIGASSNVDNSGGQDYAEFLVFTNKLTEAERLSLESYLACKWGLSGKQAAHGTITLGAGASVVGSQPGIVGTGTWTLRANDYAVLDGSFTGTVGGTGHLDVAGDSLSFTCANGAFAPALVAPGLSLKFPDAPAVTVAAAGGARLASGDYTLVEGKTLAGLTGCTLAYQVSGRARAKLVRTPTSLVLRVSSGTMVIVR